MGQYHVIANLTKKEGLEPYTFGNGAKLWEQINAHHRGSVTRSLYLLCLYAPHIKEGIGMVGRWAGDRLAIAGDYSWPVDLAPEFDAENIYGAIGTRSHHGEYLTLVDQIVPFFRKICGWKYIKKEGWADCTNTKRKLKWLEKNFKGVTGHVINLDKKEFVNPVALGDLPDISSQIYDESPGDVAAALHSLLPISNGRGGGDLGYPDTKKFAKDGYYKTIGRWAGDHIVVGDNHPDFNISTFNDISKLVIPVLEHNCMVKIKKVDGVTKKRDVSEELYASNV